MREEEIRTEREALCKVIKNANERLLELMDICVHPETFVGHFAFERPPNIYESTICKCCGKPIK